MTDILNISGHYNDVIWARWRLKSPASRLFTQAFFEAQIKENIKARRHWPLCGEFTGTGEFPAQRASNVENVSISDDVIMGEIAFDTLSRQDLTDDQSTLVQLMVCYRQATSHYLNQSWSSSVSPYGVNRP